MSGLFIAFEGIDASGKETQSKRLAEHLKAHHLSFPDYSTPSGKLIKEHLLGHWFANGVERDATVFQSLQLTNRMEWAPTMSLWLQMGETVVADRYWASGYVYGGADGLNLNWLELIHRYLPQPDLYFLLDISVEESVRRRPNRGGDRYEEDLAKLEEVADRYRYLFDTKSRHMGDKTWITLDGRLSPDEIHNQVLTHIELHRLNR